MKFERNIDPKEAMGIGYSGLIKFFDELGQPYHFYKEGMPTDLSSSLEVIIWIQYWRNGWETQ